MLFAPCCHQCGEYIQFPSRLIKGWKQEFLLVYFVQFVFKLMHLSGEFIIGRVIKAMNNSWHPDCFCCDICQAVLADVGFVKNAGRLEASHPTFFFNHNVFFNPLLLFLLSGTCVVRVTTEKKLEGSGSTSARSAMPSLRNDLCCSRMTPITPITSTATTAGKHLHMSDQQ